MLLISSVVLVLLLTFTGVDAVIIQSPLNAITGIGGNQVIFNCTANNLPTFWTWSRNGVSTNAQYIASGSCVLEPGRESNYRVDYPAGTTSCNLIVFDVTLEQAGVYTCSEVGSANAILTVIDPATNLTIYNQSEILVENDLLNISCTVRYNTSVAPAPILFPNLYWTASSPGQTFTSTYFASATNLITSVATVTVKRPIVPIFSCTASVVLSQNPPPSGYPSNVPSNVPTWNTNTVYDVLYPPDSASIDPSSPFCWSESQQFTCTASSSNPVASYQWLDHNNVTISNNQTLITPRLGKYTCIAYNTIRGIRYNVSAEIGTTITCLGVAILLSLLGLVWMSFNLLLYIFVAIRYSRNERFQSSLNDNCGCVKRTLYSKETVLADACWIFLFFLMSIIFGIFFLPVLICCTHGSVPIEATETENVELGAI